MILPPVPALVRFVKQTGHHGDCGVVTLAMLAGTLYEDSLAACISVQPTALHAGMTWAQMRQAAKILGITAKITRRYNINKDTGILNVAKKLRNGRTTDEHFIFLWAGRLVEGNGELWQNPSDYLAFNECCAFKLMTGKRQTD